MKYCFRLNGIALTTLALSGLLFVKIAEAQKSQQQSLKQTPIQSLNLESYKSQVINSDPQTIGVLENKKGAELITKESDLMTGINVFANASYLDDQRPTTNPNFQGDRTSVNMLTAGLQQQTRLGLKWSLSQNIQKTNIENASAAAIPVPEFYDAFPKLTLSIPLWRNLLGSETGAQQDQLKLQAQARLKQAEINWTQRQHEIEEVFYNLLSQQESFEIQKDSLARAEKILDWSSSRVKRNLVDTGDLYQAQAAVSARKLDLNTASVNLQDAARRFNSLRGVTGDAVIEKLIGTEVELKKLKLDKADKKVRKDLKAQSDLNLADAAGFTAARERNKPSLDLTFQGWTQGRDTSYSNAQKNIFKDEDYLYVELAFSMPIDQSNQSDIRKGYSFMEKSQQLREQARIRDEILNWDQTVDQAQQLSSQLEILRDLEVVQKKKADSERAKLSKGRSTTFQVLSFEQDYNSARTQRIRTEFETRRFINNLSLFE